MPKEMFVLEVKLGSEWTPRAQAYTEERLMEQADMYAGRAIEAGYEARIVPYVADESRAKALEPTKIVKA